jgi:hypothetical protein
MSANEEVPNSIQTVYMSLSSTKYTYYTNAANPTKNLSASVLTLINNALVNIKLGTVSNIDMTNFNTIQYNYMRSAIEQWRSEVSPTTFNNNVLQLNYRLMVVGGDGLVYYDTAANRKVTDASGNVTFSNLDASGNPLNNIVNVKKWDDVNGQFFINENLGCTVYIQGAGTAVDGTFYEVDSSYQDPTQFTNSNKQIYPDASTYSGDVLYTEEYYAVRQGLSIERPIGFVVLVRETISKVDSIPEYIPPLI